MDIGKLFVVRVNNAMVKGFFLRQFANISLPQISAYLRCFEGCERILNILDGPPLCDVKRSESRTNLLIVQQHLQVQGDLFES
jgi:hypothetical protein